MISVVWGDQTWGRQSLKDTAQGPVISWVVFIVQFLLREKEFKPEPRKTGSCSGQESTH